MTGMTDNVISLADWKAAHAPDQRKRPNVPVYVPVRDQNGKWRLELVGHTELDLTELPITTR